MVMGRVGYSEPWTTEAASNNDAANINFLNIKVLPPEDIDEWISRRLMQPKDGGQGNVSAASRSFAAKKTAASSESRLRRQLGALHQ
jgi:hypothetical protein